MSLASRGRVATPFHQNRWSTSIALRRVSRKGLYTLFNTLTFTVRFTTNFHKSEWVEFELRTQYLGPGGHVTVRHHLTLCCAITRDFTRTALVQCCRWRMHTPAAPSRFTEKDDSRGNHCTQHNWVQSRLV